MARKSYHPESQSIPENRHGTRTCRAYLLYMIKGNYPSGNVERAMAQATPRQVKKAHKLVEGGVPSKQVPGRLMRALVRASWQDYGQDLDDGYYGHP